MLKKVLALVLLFAIAIAVFFVLSTRQAPSSDPWRAWGNVDVRSAQASFEIAGRIHTLAVDEGERVKAGDVIATLNTEALTREREVALAQAQTAQAAYQELKAGYRPEDIAAARAQLLALEKQTELAAITLKRSEALFAKKAISAQKRDEARLNHEMLLAQTDQAREQYAMKRKGYRTESVEAAYQQWQARLAQVGTLDYKIDVASRLKAPANGIVRSRLAETGDMTSPGKTVYDISLVDEKRIKAYLTEKQLALIHPGAHATIETATESGIQATVARISPEAEFTPKTVQTEDIRALLVYEVVLIVEDAKNRLRLGQPVTVTFEKP